MWAAAIVVITAGGSLKRTTSPFKAIISELKSTAAGVAFWTGIVIITNLWRLYWRWRRWTWVGGIVSCLDWVRSLHRNSTYSCSCTQQITLHPDIAFLSPASTPWVSHNPVINTIICAISNSGNTMVQWCTTSSGEYTLKKSRKTNILFINSLLHGL